MSRIKRIVRSLYHRYQDYQTYRYYKDKFKNNLALRGIPDKKVDGEDEYVAFWESLSPRVERQSYRLFSRHLGKTKYILPEDIGNSVIEFYLNPVEYRPYYSDKNVFSQVVKTEGALPVELLRRINGGLFVNQDFTLSNITPSSTAHEIADRFSSYESIVLKPANNTCSGRAVCLFRKKMDPKGHPYFEDQNGQVLDGGFLEGYNYGKDFILQEAISQHPYLAQFCSTSVNTLRLCMYRSVADESISMFAAAIRIGHEGSVVDNLHAGGGFVKVDPETGKLGHCVYDRYGRMTTSLNGIDFNSDYQIPFWEEIHSFADTVVRQIPHMRLIALDVTLDQNCVPRLIEFNIKEFAFWIPMFSGQRVFGDKMEEVVSYCCQRLHRGKS